MFPVTQAYIEKLMSKSVKRRRIRGTLDGVAFTENDILKQSFSYTDIAVKSADIKLGGVFVGSLRLTFLNAFVERITRGTWRGKTIIATVGLFLGYNNGEEVWEDIPLKPYVIDEADHSALGVDVVAYDYMTKFDAQIAMSSTTGTTFGLASLACSTCGVTLGMSAADMQALPNGSETLGLFPDNDIETWRDLISWIAVTCGGFATINRNGALVFRTWKDTADIEINAHTRFAGGTWSDFQTNYTAVTVTNIEDGTQDYYSVTPDTGLTLDIGANPLLQYGVEFVKEAQRRAILNAVQSLKYVPFKSTSLIDPCLDLGDVIAYTGGIANRSKACVMRIDFSFMKGATVQGYGKNPSLNGARSARDKAISQNARNSKSQGLSYYTYVNAEALELDTTETSLYRIEFAVAEQTTVTLWHEIKLLNEPDAGNDQEVTLYYYYDGDKIEYEPVNTYGESGYHMFKGDYYLLNVEAGGSHTWEVRALINGGAASIDIGDLHALLQGQKMDASGGSDRDIPAADTFVPLLIGQEIFAPLAENVVVSTEQSGLTLYLTAENGDSVMAETGIDPIILE